MPLQFSGVGMSKKSSKKEQNTSQPPSPPRWKGLDSQELVYQLNARAFLLLKAAACATLPLWSLEEAALRRAARFPFLIVDVHFLDEAWWRQVLLNPPGVPGDPLSLWPAEVAHKFMSEVLVFAWHTARWDRRVARLVLGMVPGVVEIVRDLTPQQLDTAAGLHSGALRLRWQGNEEFWTKLLTAARDSDEEVLADIHLHAKLLLSGELMARSTGKIAP
jgi:hypothetical protein